MSTKDFWERMTAPDAPFPTTAASSPGDFKAAYETAFADIDGVSLLPYLTGQEKKSPRKLFVYISDDGDILGIRYDNWKVTFMEQRCRGTMQIWGEPFTAMRIPKIYNLRTDPYEFADVTSNTYWDWYINHVYIVYGAIALLTKFNQTFVDFPKIQKPNTFTADQAIEKLNDAVAGK